MSDDRPNPGPDERHEASSTSGADADADEHERSAADDTGDTELEAALGRALRQRVEPVWAAPPVSAIEQRVAARARARTVRRTVAGVAASATLIVGGLLAWAALDDDGTSAVVVSPADPEAEVPAAEGIAAAPADGGGTPPPTAEPGDETLGPGAGADLDGGCAAAGPSGAEDDEGVNRDGPTPEELSTGPALQWTEIDTGFDDLYGMESVGDGRIIARTPQVTDTGDVAYVAEKVIVTTNGTDWTDVPMPAEIVPEQIDISGDRWVVAGTETGFDPFDGTLGRVFFSDDQGANWTELALGLPPDPALTSPYVHEHSGVTAALASGKHIVVVVTTGRSLDLHELLEGRGLVPEGKSVLGWHSSHSGLIGFELVDAGAASGTVTLFDDGSDSMAIETMSLTYDELGLTDEERAVFDNSDGGRVLVLASDGGLAELVAEYEGWAWHSIATDEGFILKVDGPRETVITSTDGRSWSESPSLGDGHSAWVAGLGGAIWRVGLKGFETLIIQRADYGGAPVTVAACEGLSPMGGLAAGPAGLITTSVPAAPYGPANQTAGMLEGRIAKDGYELRYNEPQGGITLWDLAEDSAVYVFESDDIVGEQPPEGVREVTDGGGFAVVFEDPDTGADLVTFTQEDLAAVFMSAGDGMAVPLTLEEYEPPDVWVGWSADGTAWGWQLMADAFGIESGQPWAEFAVGGDFVLARVQAIEAPQALGPVGDLAVDDPEALGSLAGGLAVDWGDYVEPEPPRWFIGRAP